MTNLEQRVREALRCTHSIHTKAGHSSMACWRCGGHMYVPPSADAVARALDIITQHADNCDVHNGFRCNCGANARRDTFLAVLRGE